MSETATATPEAVVTEKPTQASAELSLADALDAGIDALETTPQKSEAQIPVADVQTPEVSKSQSAEVKSSDKTNSASSTPLDILTKRLTGSEESEIVKTESSEELEVKTPDNLKPEAQTAWARLTKDLREARAKIKELETKRSEPETTPMEQVDLKAQLDALKAERDEYESELRLSRLESTKEYKAAVTEPLSVIQKEVADISALYETDPRGIYAAMAEPDPAVRRSLLKELTAKFDPVDSLAVRNKAEELHKVFARRDVLTKDVKTVLEMLENDERSEFEAAQKRAQVEIETAYRTEWENLQKENPLLRPIQDNESWNNVLKGIEKQALEIEATELDPRSKARLTFNAAAMPVVMQVFQDYVSKSQSRIQELEKLAKELRSTLPGAGASSGSSPEIPSDLNFLDALERGLK